MVISAPIRPILQHGELVHELRSPLDPTADGEKALLAAVLFEQPALLARGQQRGLNSLLFEILVVYELADPARGPHQRVVVARQLARGLGKRSIRAGLHPLLADDLAVID